MKRPNSARKLVLSGNVLHLRSVSITASMLYDYVLYDYVLCKNRPCMDLYANEDDRDDGSPILELLWR